MIEKVMLQDWGIYESWESPDFGSITDIIGKNTVGKTTLLDGITVGLGLCRQHDLYKNRSPADYQRTNAPVAYVGLWLTNAELQSGRRRFSSFKEPQITVIARVRGSDDQVTTYRVFDGALSLKECVDTARGKWRSPADYNSLMKKAGLGRDRVRGRIFRVNDIEKIQGAKPNDLHDEFRKFCSSEEVIRLQRQALKAKVNAENEERRLRDEERRQDRDFARLQKQLTDTESLESNYVELEDQQLLLAVANAVETEEQLNKALARRDESEREAAKVQVDKQVQEKQLKVEMKQLEVHVHQRDGLQNQVNNAQERREKMERDYQIALRLQEKLLEDGASLKALEAVPPTDQIQSKIDTLTQERDSTLEEKATQKQALKLVEEELASLKDSGLVAKVQHCQDEIRAAGIGFQAAVDVLPRNKTAGYEEFVGRARFGILVSEADADRALEIAKKHRYPGPVTTLNAKEYAKHFDSQDHDEGGFSTEIGQFALMGDQPVLNKSLVKDAIRSLERRRDELNVDTQRLENQIGRMDSDITRLRHEEQQAIERDRLVEESKTWAKKREAAQETITIYGRVQGELDTSNRNLAEADYRVRNCEQTIEKLNTKIQELTARLPEKQDDEIGILQGQFEDAMASCGDSFEVKKQDAMSVKHHSSHVEKLQGKIRGQDRPDPEVLQSLRDEEKSLLEALESLQTQIESATLEQRKQAQNLKQLREEHQEAEDRAFRKVKKRIEQLGTRYGCPVKVERQLVDAEQDYWKLLYKVSNQVGDDGEPIWDLVHESAGSTGEGMKAALLFMMGLTEAATGLFYIFDEPAKHFSEDNVEDMFQIFQECQSQVLLTSAKKEDYGEENVIVHQVYLQAEVKQRNRRALPARYNVFDNRVSEYAVSAA